MYTLNDEMAIVQTIMSELYDVLLRVKYLDITKAEPETLATTILSGENRVTLLCWILMENSPVISASLKKLNGSALEDELVKLYSDIGICDSKDILLGKCKLEEQSSTLKLLLDFVKTMLLDCPIEHNVDDSVDGLIKICLEDSKSTNSKSYNANCKLIYSEAKQYFEDTKNDLNELDLMDENVSLSNDDRTLSNEEDYAKSAHDQEILYDAQTKKFVDAFESVSSWPMSNTQPEGNLKNINSEMKNICTDFSALKQVLHANTEISKTVIPNGVSQISTPLNSLLENIVTNAEAVINTYEIEHHID